MPILLSIFGFFFSGKAGGWASIIAAIGITLAMGTIDKKPFYYIPQYIVVSNEFWLDTVRYLAYLYTVLEVVAIIRRLPIERDKIGEMVFDAVTAVIPPIALVVAIALYLERGWGFDAVRQEIVIWWGIASAVDIYIGYTLMIQLAKYASPLETSGRG